ncbi:hypothetical protein Tco_0040199 [Tanacetum coccineum]
MSSNTSSKRGFMSLELKLTSNSKRGLEKVTESSHGTLMEEKSSHEESMANAEQALARASPVRTDEQIVPRNRWVPIGKSNCYLNEEKSQRSPIFKIAVDILKQTNFLDWDKVLNTRLY